MTKILRYPVAEERRWIEELMFLGCPIQRSEDPTGPLLQVSVSKLSQVSALDSSESSDPFAI